MHLSYILGLYLFSNIFLLREVCAENNTTFNSESCENSDVSHVPASFSLHNSIEVDLLGFGTACLQENTYKSVKLAINSGYRHFDSAQAYEWYREWDIGEAIYDSIHETQSLTRKDFFIVTKVHPRDYNEEKLLTSFELSLKNLKTDYVDLILLHCLGEWPAHASPFGIACPESSASWLDAWDVLEKLYAEGLVKAIGVSNANIGELQQLWEHAKIKPHAIQNWFDPFHQDIGVRSWCAQKNILYTGYSTFGTQWLDMSIGVPENPVFSSTLLNQIALAHRVAVSQVVLSWAFQKGIAVLPCSKNEKHIVTNAEFTKTTTDTNEFEVFLSQNEMTDIDLLDGTLVALVNTTS